MCRRLHFGFNDSRWTASMGCICGAGEPGAPLCARGRSRRVSPPASGFAWPFNQMGDRKASASIPLGPKAVPKPTHRLDQGIVTGRCQPNAKPANVDIYAAFFEDCVVTPDLVEE